MIASFSKSSNVVGSITLWKILLKNIQRRVMTYLTLLGKMPQIATRRSCWMRTRQSWDFKQTNFKSSIDTKFPIPEEYPSGTFVPPRLSQKLIFSSLDRVWQAGGKNVCLPWPSSCNSKWRPISTWYLRELILSLVYLWCLAMFHMHDIYAMLDI